MKMTGENVIVPKLKILLSYWYYKNEDLEGLFKKYFSGRYPEVFADSGAYSAMTQNSSVNIDEYAAWLNKWSHLITTYANLDVIKDAKKTWENQLVLEGMGLTPLPAFHVLEDFKWLEMYVEKYRYIALGVAGMQSRRDAIMSWLVKCFKIAGDKSVFHGFALTSWNVMKSFRWYSVDSSSWGQGFRYGQVPIFDSKSGIFYKAGLGKPSEWRKIAPIVHNMGFDPSDFSDRSRNDRGKICAISALSYMKAEKYLQKILGPVYIPGNNSGSADLRSHLADANPSRFIESEAGLKIHLSETSMLNNNFADADRGIKLYLVDANGNNGGDLAAIGGLKLYLAEHSLDRGGVGDTSRACEVLDG